MTRVTDDQMRAELQRSRAYTLVLLRPTAKRAAAGVEPILWEHARRNFELRADGVLLIVCPVRGSDDLNGIGIFNAPADEVRRLMDGDPAVQAGLFTYEVHTVASFPGDRLPG